MTYEIHPSFGGRGYSAIYRPGVGLPHTAAFDVTPDGCARAVRRRIAAGTLPPGRIVHGS